MFPIISKASNCLDCYRCLRGCGVKAISFSSGQAKIMTDKCVLCGRCIHECPQQTKSVRDQLVSLQQFLETNQVAIGLAPTFQTHFSQWTPEQIMAKLKQMGFAVVEEVAQFGQSVFDAYEQKNGQEYTITSHCPVVVNLVERYFPDLIPHLMNTESLANRWGRDVKSRYGQRLKVVYATSCLAEMECVQRYDGVDLVIPFAQLATLLPSEPLTEAQRQQYGQTPQYGLVGQHLALAGGLSEQLVVQQYLNPAEVQSYSGIKDCYEVLQGLAKRGTSEVKLVDLMACRGGCINGMDLSAKGTLLEKRAQLIKRFERYKNLPSVPPLSQEGTTAETPLFQSKLVVAKAVDTQAIKGILEELRLYNQRRVLNCGACGYDTCYQRAVAVVSGEAEADMCISHMKSKAESMAHTIVRSNPNAIIVFDQDFIIQEFNNAAREMFAKYGLRPGNALFEYIDIRHIEKVVETGIGVRDKVIHYPDLDLWTRQVIVQMYETRKLYLAILTDITEHEKKQLELERMKEETLIKANQVINNQMLVAQQIAGLLGETTAETKMTLLDLMRHFTQEKELE